MTKIGQDHKRVVYLLWGSLFLYFVGIIVTIVGLCTNGTALLQNKANSIDFTQAPAELINAYRDLYAQGGASPYPFNPELQFAFWWWVGVLELLIFVAIIGTAFNQYRLHRGRFVLLTFLAVAQAIVYRTIDQLLYFSRQEAPKQIYGASKIYTAVAGAIILAVGNGFATIALGLVEPDPATLAVSDAVHSSKSSDSDKNNKGEDTV